MFECYDAVTYYGINSIIRQYSGFPSYMPLPISIQHGWDVGPNPHDACEHAPENWYWSARIERQYHEKYPNITTRSVGAPFLYLLKLIGNSSLPQSERSGSIVFPSHSSKLTEMNCDFDKYATMLLELPEKYQPITVCMYYIDRDRSLDAPFLHNGFQVVTNGSNLFESDFLLNFVRNSRNKKFAFSNQMTSALLFASAMGLTSYFWGPQFSVNNFDPHWQHLDYNEYFREWEDEYRCYFRFPDCDVAEQAAIVDAELGKDKMLSRTQMRILLWRLTCDRRYIEKLKDRNMRRCRQAAKRTVPLSLALMLKRFTAPLRSVLKRYR